MAQHAGRASVGLHTQVRLHVSCDQVVRAKGERRVKWEWVYEVELDRIF